MVATNRSSGGASSRDDTSTQEQRDLVFKIRRTRNYYDILGLQRSASDDEIKRAYRKLALKLHPDKCTAVGSDEAFKLVSRAFSCLSDGTKRAAYDRYGEETPGLSRAQNGGAPAGGNPFGFNEDFDPEQLFNMFFNGGFGGAGFGGPRGPVFRTHFGGGPGFRRHAGPAPAQQQPANPAAQLLHFLPVLFLLLFTFLQMPSQPVYSLDKAGEYRHQVDTQRLGVPYFVRNVAALDKLHPPGSRDRGRLEAEVEVLHKERLEQRCYSERLNQQTLFRWGQAERAKAYQLPNCEALRSMFGATRVY